MAVLEDAFVVHLASVFPTELVKKNLATLKSSASADAKQMLDAITGDDIDNLPPDLRRRVKRLMDAVGRKWPPDKR